MGSKKQLASAGSGDSLGSQPGSRAGSLAAVPAPSKDSFAERQAGAPRGRAAVRWAPPAAACVLPRRVASTTGRPALTILGRRCSSADRPACRAVVMLCPTAEVEVSVDNETSGAHSMMSLRCADRKGLLYDLFRSLKDIDLRCAARDRLGGAGRGRGCASGARCGHGRVGAGARGMQPPLLPPGSQPCQCCPTPHPLTRPPCSVAYGRVEVYEDGMCEVDLFVQDQEGGRITDGCAPGAGRCRGWALGALPRAASPGA